MTMEFLAPTRLLLLAALVPLAGYLYWAEGVRSHRLALLGLDCSDRIVRLLAPLIVCLLLGVAVARPYIGYRDISFDAQGRDLIIAVDVSMSMLATDATPSRLEVAKRKIFDLIELSYRSQAPLRIGIVTFAGGAYRFCPLTSDMEIVRSFAENLTPELMTSLGSSLANAVTTSLQTLAQIGTTSAAVLIISDGEDLDFRIDSVSSTIKDSGVPFFTLGVGLAQGVPIPLRGGRFFSDTQGNIVITKLNEAPLRDIATTGGGIYQAAKLTDQDLVAIMQSLPEAHEQRSSGSKIRSYNEVGPWLVAAALGLILVALATRKAAVLFGIFILLCRPSPGFAQEPSPPPSLEQAYEAYVESDYHTALRGFEAAYAKDPNNPSILEGLARTYYRLGQYNESGQIFKQLESQAKTGRDLFSSSYNRGNAALLGKDFDTAISSYERALSTKPQDVAASSNLALAKRLKEQHQQQSSSSSIQSSSQPSQSSSSEQSSPKTDQRSSEEPSSSQASTSSSSDGQGSSELSSSASSKGQSSQDESSAPSSSSAASKAIAQSVGSESSAPKPSSTPGALKLLNKVEDKPLLPKQPRNRDNLPPSGQIW